MIKSWAFESTANLKEITIPESVKELGEFAFWRSGLESVIIPSKISVLPKYCLALACLKSITLSEGLEVIEGAFIGCDELKSLTLPSSVIKIEIGSTDFRGLSEMYIKAIIPPALKADPKSKLFKVYVPRSSVDAYKEKWSAYKDFIIGYDF